MGLILLINLQQNRRIYNCKCNYDSHESRSWYPTLTVLHITLHIFTFLPLYQMSCQDCQVYLVLFILHEGLVLRNVFLYLVKVRQRRERYLAGIKALGEHMHMVTRRISIAPNNKSSSSSSSSNNNSVVSKPKEVENWANRGLNALRASKLQKIPSRAIADAESVWICRTLEIKNGCRDS